MGVGCAPTCVVYLNGVRGAGYHELIVFVLWAVCKYFGMSMFVPDVFVAVLSRKRYNSLQPERRGFLLDVIFNVSCVGSEERNHRYVIIVSVCCVIHRRVIDRDSCRMFGSEGGEGLPPSGVGKSPQSL